MWRRSLAPKPSHQTFEIVQSRALRATACPALDRQDFFLGLQGRLDHFEILLGQVDVMCVVGHSESILVIIDHHMGIKLVYAKLGKSDHRDNHDR